MLKLVRHDQPSMRGASSNVESLCVPSSMRFEFESLRTLEVTNRPKTRINRISHQECLHARATNLARVLSGYRVKVRCLLILGPAISGVLAMPLTAPRALWICEVLLCVSVGRKPLLVLVFPPFAQSESTVFSARPSWASLFDSSTLPRTAQLCERSQ